METSTNNNSQQRHIPLPLSRLAVCSSSPRPEVELDSPTSGPAGQPRSEDRGPAAEDRGPAAEDRSPPEHQQPLGGRLPKKQLSVAFVNEKQA